MTDSANVFEIHSADYTNPLADVITNYAAAEQYDTDKWGEMVRLTYKSDDGTVFDAEGWKEYYLDAESEQAAVRESAGEVIPRTKKTGAIVASKAFPKTWNTDKAIIGKALTEGIELFDDTGEVKPKSALQKEYRDAEKDTDKTAFEKILTTINTLNTLYSQLGTQDEVDAAKAAIEQIIN